MTGLCSIRNMRHLTPDIEREGKNPDDKAACHPSGQHHHHHHHHHLTLMATTTTRQTLTGTQHHSLTLSSGDTIWEERSTPGWGVTDPEQSCPTFRFLPRDRFTPSLHWVARTVTSYHKNTQRASINKWVKLEQREEAREEEKEKHFNLMTFSCKNKEKCTVHIYIAPTTNIWWYLFKIL